ncbi:MAG: hypothetical protein SAJ12_04960 [Jaaginema sp. PMC 1079.18]|nr:hypothetical protein [Jaaginema sp. PMC 1080.18]MEC4850343.1 hypothetical protein [Jaaginema sp. PMC 1079.18]MEC4865596.1 hypothetical protein [Jaaginema sp. PMC 1078.18]
MVKSWLGFVGCTSVLWGSLLLSGKTTVAQPMPSFSPLHRYVVEGSAAEIVAATSDGNIIAYTNKDEQDVGIIDIRNPQSPEKLAVVSVADLGEPTAIAIKF